MVGSEELRTVRSTEEGDGEDDDVLKETRAERQMRRRSHVAAYVTMFIMAVGFSIVLTGVWPYLQQLDESVSKEFLGWVVAANPLGQMLASPLFGFWGNKAGRVRVAFIWSILFFALGNAMYAVLHVFGSTAKYFMVFSRFIVGVSSASVSICRSYIADSTTLKERTMGMSIIAASQAIGFIVGPAIQTALAVGFMQTVDGPNGTFVYVPYDTDLGVWGVRWNMYTAAGWVAVFIGFLNLLLFLPIIFQEHNITQRLVRANDDNAKKYHKPDYPALIGILFVFFIILFVYVLLETLLVPMCLDLYAWHTEFAVTVVGIGLSAAGVFCLFIFGILGVLAKYVDERKILIGMGLIPITLSMLMHFPMGSTYPKMSNCTISYVESNDTHQASFINTTSGALEIMSLAVHKVNDEVKVCDSLGCPPEQEWCTYTPIIEKSQMLAADIVALIGYPTSVTMVQTIFSKMLGPRPQGVLMGVLTSTGSFSRMAGPIFVSYVYTNLGTRWTFGILFVCMIFTIIESFYFFKRQIPCVAIQSPTTEPLQSSE
ncbi:major facilitator superfamily domain-containing protein 8-like isoform X2 [Oratosquilla oratoria]